MSYTYLLESGEESSAECYSDIPAFVLSKSSRSAEKFSCKGNATESSQNSQSGTTCEHLTANRGEEKSTASAEASPAKTSQRQAKARASTEREAGCGQSSLVLLAKYDRDTRLWKTLQCSFLGDSEECLETFPKSGIMRGGVLWELTKWAHPTVASESGFWRIPDTGAGGTVSEKTLEEMANGNWKRPSGSQKQLRLQDQVRELRLWPTPNCSGMDGGSNSRKANKKRGIHQKLYPTPKYLTPKASDKGYAESQSTFVKRNGDRTMNCYASLSSQVLQMSGGDTTPQTKTARLNPYWVEWLMGWPIGWTDSKPLATDKFRSWRQQLLTF